MTVTTRSGRNVNKPERYEPVEQVTDDFSDSEYDSECSYDSDCGSIISESTMFSDDVSDDEDEEGNLKGFVVDSDEEESEEEEEEESEEVQKKTKKRKKVKCEETA
jgi:hypothetical protein